MIIRSGEKWDQFLHDEQLIEVCVNEVLRTEFVVQPVKEWPDVPIWQLLRFRGIVQRGADVDISQAAAAAPIIVLSIYNTEKLYAQPIRLMFRLIVGLLIATAIFAQKPADVLAGEMAKRLSGQVHAKTIVGKPITVGSVTLIPILNVEVSFGGAGMVAPPPAPAPANRTAAPVTAKPPQGPPPSGDLFLMNGEARPLGFVVVSKQGTRFISLQAAERK